MRLSSKPSRPPGRVPLRLLLLALPFLVIGYFLVLMAGQRGAPFVVYALEATLSGQAGAVTAQLDPNDRSALPWCGPEAFTGAGGLTETYARGALSCRAFEVVGTPCWRVLPITCPTVTVARPGFEDAMLVTAVQSLIDRPCDAYQRGLSGRQELPAGTPTYGLTYLAVPHAWHSLSCDWRDWLGIPLPGTVRQAPTTAG